MGYFIGIAFWILSGCLLTKSKVIPQDIVVMRQLKNAKCPDSIFYAPPNVVKNHCFTTALDCVIRQLDGTAIEKCEESAKYYIDRALDILEDRKNMSSSNGCALMNSTGCETGPHISLSVFVEKVVHLLQLQTSVESKNASRV